MTVIEPSASVCMSLWVCAGLSPDVTTRTIQMDLSMCQTISADRDALINETMMG